jgi:hypothetical protein
MVFLLVGEKASLNGRNVADHLIQSYHFTSKETESERSKSWPLTAWGCHSLATCSGVHSRRMFCFVLIDLANPCF